MECTIKKYFDNHLLINDLAILAKTYMMNGPIGKFIHNECPTRKVAKIYYHEWP